MLGVNESPCPVEFISLVGAGEAKTRLAASIGHDAACRLCGTRQTGWSLRFGAFPVAPFAPCQAPDKHGAPQTFSTLKGNVRGEIELCGLAEKCVPSLVGVGGRGAQPVRCDHWLALVTSTWPSVATLRQG